MKLNVSEVVRSVLEHCAGESDFDRELTAECRRRFGEQADGVLDSLRRFLDGQARRNGVSRYVAAQQFADGEATVTRRTYGAVEDMPPELQARVREMTAQGKTSMTTEKVTRIPVEDATPEMIERAIAQKERLLRARGGPKIIIRIGGRLRRPAWWFWILFIVALAIYAIVFMLKRLETETEGKGLTIWDSLIAVARPHTSEVPLESRR